MQDKEQPQRNEPEEDDFDPFAAGQAENPLETLGAFRRHPEMVKGRAVLERERTCLIDQKGSEWANLVSLLVIGRLAIGVMQEHNVKGDKEMGKRLAKATISSLINQGFLTNLPAKLEEAKADAEAQEGKFYDCLDTAIAAKKDAK